MKKYTRYTADGFKIEKKYIYRMIDRRYIYRTIDRRYTYRILDRE